jgi:putative acetyltransferase
MEITTARTPLDLEIIRTLFREYQDELDVDLCFQGFEAELAALPGKYSPPRGALRLARAGVAVAGCVALRNIAPGTCEMKRLYVRPPFRGSGLGRRLAVDIIAKARTLGYERMRLDTLDRLTAAMALYRSLGFEDIPAYYPNPLPGVRYWQLDFNRAAAS